MQHCEVILADNHTLFRQGLKKILEETSFLKVVGEVSNGRELLNLLKTLAPYVVILDISMPDLREMDGIREIKRISPGTKIVILTARSNLEYIRISFSKGADGYLLKEDSSLELLSAVEKIWIVESYVSPRLAEALREDSVHMRGDKLPSCRGLQHLTHRERQVLKLVAEGKSNKEIATLLFISTRTVECHRANIMEKLNLKGTANLVRYATQKGYV